MTSAQLAREFWPDSKYPLVICNRRLKVLRDLKCLDSHYPVVNRGSALQHLVLDVAGSKILGLTHWNKMAKLPISYGHRITVNEIIYLASKLGLPEPQLEHYLGFDKRGLKVDVFFQDLQASIEVDCGTETYKQLSEKGRRYRLYASDLQTVALITTGPFDRAEAFFQPLDGVIPKRLAQRVEKADRVLLQLREGITI